MMNIFNTENYDEEVMKSEMPVIVYYYSERFPACKAMAAIFAQVSGEHIGEIKFGKVNIDDSPNLAVSQRVLSIPALLFYKDGQLKGRLEGADTKSIIDQKIKKYYNL